MSESSQPWRRASLTSQARISPPVDTSASYDSTALSGKTILITGGASGFGEGFLRKWASHGANCIIGDINDSRGISLINEIRQTTQNLNHHYIHCDVTYWQSQVNLFRQASKLSPHGGIDAVVANAGISEPHPTFQNPQDMDSPNPRKPDFKCLEVNLLGVMYTAHLAFHFLPQNPGSDSACPPAPTSNNVFPSAEKKRVRDRHLLLIGSCASIMPLPGQVLYSTSKHGVLGLFRSLRSTSFVNGIRVNLIMPYYVDTPLLPTAARLILAGGAMGKPEDVVDAGTRLMADASIVGHGLVVGPKVKVEEREDGEFFISQAKGEEKAVWDVCVDDFEKADVFNERFLKLLNQVERAKGWTGLCMDLIKAVFYPFNGLWKN